MSPERVGIYREFPADRIPDFVAKGIPQQQFFPHRTYALPKCGPDGLYLSTRLCATGNPRALWQIVLFADGPVLDRFPNDLFFDDDVMWHRQHFGERGQIALAKVVMKGRRLYATNYQSDLVQRISRRREFKSQIKSRFDGWPSLLLNSVMVFALENGVTHLYSPTADLVMRHTDPRRTVKRELFDRIYDRTVQQRFNAGRRGSWWVIDVQGNRERVVFPERKQAPQSTGKQICVCHDLERGWGHWGSDPRLAEEAERGAGQTLERMLRTEEEAGVRVTYNVVGRFFNEVREPIEQGGHCLAFHSYNHTAGSFWWVTNVRSRIAARLDELRGKPSRPRYFDQLAALRSVDYRVRGFRPPQSKLTSEWSDRRLCFHNFDWMASSSASLGLRGPALENRLVKIPISFDDFPLYRGKLQYEEWERQVLRTVESERFVAFCLHDCYAPWWLPHYARLLSRIQEHGRVRTMNEVADSVFLASGQ